MSGIATGRQPWRMKEKELYELIDNLMAHPEVGDDVSLLLGALARRVAISAHRYADLREVKVAKLMNLILTRKGAILILGKDEDCHPFMGVGGQDVRAWDREMGGIRTDVDT